MRNAEIAAYSINGQGDRLLSMLVTFPRIILSEVNTHRMLCKNTSSSRAIPFLKSVKMVMDGPFIPYGFQKHHPGMQGTEYLNMNEKVKITTFFEMLLKEAKKLAKDSNEFKKLEKRIDELALIIETYTPVTERFTERTLPEWWLFARDKAVQSASILYAMGVTKQICNRILEPFMWTTMLITGSVEYGWDNFFNLRCPAYTVESDGNKYVFKSVKELARAFYETGEKFDRWHAKNKSQAEIHIQALAEDIYDLLIDAKPKFLKPGEWHIPFEDKIDLRSKFVYETITEEHKEFHRNRTMFILKNDELVFAPKGTEGSHSEYFGDLKDIVRGFEMDGTVYTYINDFEPIESAKVVKLFDDTTLEFRAGTKDGFSYEYYSKIPPKVKVSTSMAARTSYTVIEAAEVSIQKHIALHDDLLSKRPPHSSPTEHCHRCMDEEEYGLSVKGRLNGSQDAYGVYIAESYSFVNENGELHINKETQDSLGWCYSAKGFIPYRFLIENSLV